MKSFNVVPIQQPCNAVVHTAIVLSVADNNLCEIDLSGARCFAQVTYSCLVKPVNDDVVMCVLSEAGDYYITGIIERKAEQSMSISFPGDVKLQSLSGSITLYAADSVTMAAADSLNCVSKKVLHKSEKAIVNYDDLIASGSTAQGNYSTIRIFSKLVSTVSKQVLQKCRNYIRQSDESDLVKAGNMTRKAQGVYSVNSQNTVMLSKKDTKIDGEHIHMG